MKPIEINGENYYTVEQFAQLTNKASQTIRGLMHKGNRIRKLKFVHFGNKPFIPATEVTCFPFTVSGRNNNDIYHYNQKGVIINAK